MLLSAKGALDTLQKEKKMRAFGEQIGEFCDFQKA